MNLTPTEVLDVGLDWLTVTSKQKIHGILLASRSDELVASELVEGAISTPFSRSGYVGFDVGRVGVGIRDMDCICRLSGALAQQRWRELAAVVTNCSRIDLQVTARFELPAKQVISRLFRRLKTQSQKQKGGPTLSLWQESDGDSTIYLGKRSSERFARIYDKGAESGMDHYQNAVRFEVEVKGDLAWSFWSKLKEAHYQDVGPYPSHGEKSLVRDCVVDYFNQRGVKLAIALDGTALLRSAGTRSDLVRRLEWLRSSCSFAVAECIERGFDIEVMQSLFPDVTIRKKMLQTLRAWEWSTGTDTDCDSVEPNERENNVSPPG